jgi:hypothetical protein
LHKYHNDLRDKRGVQWTLILLDCLLLEFYQPLVLEKAHWFLGFVLSTPGFDPVWYDFATDGKPHLLCRSSNGYGAEYKISHCSSVAYFLADQAQGKPWNGNRGRKSIARLIKENMKTIGIKIKNIGGTRAISINQVLLMETGKVV